MFIKATNVDDLLRDVLQQLLRRGSRIHPTRGAAAELPPVLLCLTNPRARLSRTESKGKIFSCLSELLWYLAQSDDLAFISYYLSHYLEESDDGRMVYGAYGPRLFNFRQQSQLGNVVRLLKRNAFSRKAVVQLFDATGHAFCIFFPQQQRGLRFPPPPACAPFVTSTSQPQFGPGQGYFSALLR
jgi:thymidylate synthase